MSSMSSISTLLADQRSATITRYRHDALGAVGKGGLDGGRGRANPDSPWDVPWEAAAADHVHVARVTQTPVYSSLIDAVAAARRGLCACLTDAGVHEQALVSALATSSSTPKQLALVRAAHAAAIVLVDTAVRRLHALDLLGAVQGRAEPDAVDLMIKDARASIDVARLKAVAARSVEGVVDAHLMAHELALKVAQEPVRALEAISVIVRQPVIALESLSALKHRTARHKRGERLKDLVIKNASIQSVRRQATRSGSRRSSPPPAERSRRD